MTAPRLPHKDWRLFEPDLSDYRPERERREQPIPAWTRTGRSYEDLHTAAWRAITEQWGETVLAYEATPDDFYSAWYYIDEHPAFWDRRADMGLSLNHVSAIDHSNGVGRALDISPHVNEETGKTQVFYEVLSSEWENPESGWHDWYLDGAEDTYEQVIIAAARKIWDYFGNDMSRRPPVEMGMDWLIENGFVEREDMTADGRVEDAREADVERADGAVAPRAD